MRKYETFFIVNPDLADEATAAVDEKIKGVVSNNDGMVITYSPWGKKKLAYTVKKHTRGLYILMEYAGGPALVAELERQMRLDERVLKFITVKLDDRYDPEKEAAKLEAEKTPASEETAEADTEVAESAGEPESETEPESEESIEE